MAGCPEKQYAQRAGQISSLVIFISSPKIDRINVIIVMTFIPFCALCAPSVLIMNLIVEF